MTKFLIKNETANETKFHPVSRAVYKSTQRKCNTSYIHAKIRTGTEYRRGVTFKMLTILRKRP